MQAFHNDMKIKEKYLDRVLAHQKADEIIHGIYWENGKGCAVGCTIHSGNHKYYEKELGIPEWLARLEDTLFEGLQNGRAKAWPAQFLEAIKPGVDLEQVKKPFTIFILEQNLTYLDQCKFDADKWPDVKSAIDGSRAAAVQTIEALKSGSESAARSAESAAWSAESAARSAARSAAWSAESAERAARSAARSAESAAWSAESAASAARSAARSAESAAWSAESAARSAAYEKYADKLLELLKECE